MIKSGRLLRVPEASTRLGIRASTLRKMIFLREIAFVKIGRTVSIPEDVIEKMILDGYNKPIEKRNVKNS